MPLGPRAQTILRPFLVGPPDQFLFSPRAAEDWRNEQRGLHRDPRRKTRILPSELRARERRKLAAKSRRAKRAKRCSYDVDSYRRAITYGIRKANKVRQALHEPTVPHWSPLQLRHSCATEVRKKFGLEGAQMALGHTHANVTERYAERNLELAIQIARDMG